MTAVPQSPKIFHITRVENLSEIVNSGCLWSDAKRIEMNLGCHLVGMSVIKQRRLDELKVKCHPSTQVGHYVPFYFCPRSVMLFILHKGNHPDVTYKDGQRLIVHLQADLNQTVAWAQQSQRLWAFSTTNAGAAYTDFYSDLNDLDSINWTAVNSTDFKDRSMQEGKQAEFLVFEHFPWELVEKIGVIDLEMAEEVRQRIHGALHQPQVYIERQWYY